MQPRLDEATKLITVRPQKDDTIIIKSDHLCANWKTAPGSGNVRTPKLIGVSEEGLCPSHANGVWPQGLPAGRAAPRCPSHRSPAWCRLMFGRIQPFGLSQSYLYGMFKGVDPPFEWTFLSTSPEGMVRQYRIGWGRVPPPFFRGTRWGVHGRVKGCCLACSCWLGWRPLRGRYRLKAVMRLPLHTHIPRKYRRASFFVPNVPPFPLTWTTEHTSSFTWECEC